MPDFSKFLAKDLSTVKRPPPLPAGSYYATINSYEVGESQKKKTPYVRIHLTLTAPFEEIAGEVATAEIDLTKRKIHRDYFLTDEADWRLKDMIESCGIDLSGLNFGSALPQLTNQPVIVEVKIEPGQRQDEVFNSVTDVKGQHGG